MKPIVKQMVKEVLIEGFVQSRCDIGKMEIKYPRGGCSTNRKDIERAYHIALMKLQIMQEKKRVGEPSIPSSIEEFERFLDRTLAEQSFMDAYTLINQWYSDRNNSSLVEEMKESINELHLLGDHEKASNYELLLKQRIGEE